jgi:CubicO group peptidase (beta-lactamase class C family)
VPDRLARLLEEYDRRTDTSAVVFALAQPSTGWTWTHGDPGAPYAIASITKLHTTALIVQLADQGLLGLDDPIERHLEPEVVRGLSVVDGVDRGHEITVRQLLAHTSGIADYFEQRRTDGTTTFGRALAGGPGWTFSDAISIAKTEMRPRFRPGAPGKASYSDTNFQLLGAIIERVTGDSYASALQSRVIAPLGLTRTYLFSPTTMDRYDDLGPLLLGTRPIRIPQVLASVGADGGIVSTATEGLRFLRAFFAGELFPARYLGEMQREWRRIFFPLQYGMGLMRYALPRVMTGFRVVPPMIGHSGASGAVAFHSPDTDLFVVGTVNQVEKRSLAFRLLTRLTMLAPGRA